MSESSNVSVKDLPPSSDANELFLPNVNQFVPKRAVPVAHFTPVHQSSNETPDVKLPASDSTVLTHRPVCLPQFTEPAAVSWTASHAANSPSEDRSSSLVNLLLQPLPANFDSETQLPPLEPDYKTLIRLNLWSVIDGHGGGSVATYASEVLLPHIAASVSRALGCAIVDRGVCTVNGQLRDANALDLDGLIQTSDRSMGNRRSIHYRSPYERSDSEEEGLPETPVQPEQPPSVSGATTLFPGSAADATVSSVKTSVKTAASPANREALIGTHSPPEVAAITQAITESFLAVDEGWINSIDPVATHQSSCQSNGRWNSGACALVVFTVQRLDWTSVSEPDREKEARGPDKARKNTSQNRDAARRRMLDYATRTKSASSMSTVSSTSSLTTEEAVHASGIESEITETEGEEDDRLSHSEDRKRVPSRHPSQAVRLLGKESLISQPGGCSCHCYRAHDAILYTAHVGDCRAVLLGSAPPRTIKVRDTLHQDTTDDESSHHSSDETECLSSSDHDADSSEEEDVETEAGKTSTATSSYMNFPRRVVRQRSSRRASDDTAGPYIALPPLENDEPMKRVELEFETEIERREHRRKAGKDPSLSSSSSQESFDPLRLVHMPPVTRPIDLTTDHSAYNPAEVTAVLRRCNNAPRAISAGVGGGIKRVAGSLAVTRALGDAYLKTPLLSFLPYKSHAPYITARPEVNCRPIVKEGDKVLILATDGVWERASGEDVLRWVRNFYEERIAKAERLNRLRLNPPEKAGGIDKQSSSDKVSSADDSDGGKNPKEMSERDLFAKAENEGTGGKSETDCSSKKRDPRDLARSPSPPAKRRRRGRRALESYNVADVIVRRVLNKVRRARNISSLQALMSLPPGRARRSKHDDITASVVDLSAFVA